MNGLLSALSDLIFPPLLEMTISTSRVEGFPSKSVGLFVEPSLIFRSDSNGEDLEGYAGAGLYDSITMQKTQQRKINYAEDRITNDKDFQHKV